MFDYALKTDRYIGMIQPSDLTKDNSSPESSHLFPLASAGKIVAFNQTNDNRYEKVLHGICRFKIIEDKTGLGVGALFQEEMNDRRTS